MLKYEKQTFFNVFSSWWIVCMFTHVDLRKVNKTMWKSKNPFSNYYIATLNELNFNQICIILLMFCFSVLYHTDLLSLLLKKI